MLIYVWSSLTTEYGSTAQSCQSCSGSAEQGKLMFPCLRSRLRIWSRETGSAVPSRVSLPILHTWAESSIIYVMLSHGIPPDFLGGVHLQHLNCHTPSGQYRVYRVTQLRTNGVHCRESAGTGPVALKVVPVTGAAFSGFTMDQFMCASLFSFLPLVLYVL